MIRRILFLLILTGFVFGICGCQTVQGIGGDIQWAGEKGAEWLGGDDTVQ